MSTISAIGIGVSVLGGRVASYNALLPQKLITTPDVYTEEMDAAVEWTLSGAGATMAANNTEFKSGTGSLKLTSSSGGVAQIGKQVNWDLSGGKQNSFCLWVYVHSASDTYGNFKILLGNEPTAWTNYWSVYFFGTSSSLKTGQWTMFWLDPGLSPSGWVVEGGTPNWNSIKRMRIEMSLLAGKVRQCSFDLLTVGKIRKSCVVMGFDDGLESTYTKAYPLIKAKKMVATTYVISDLIDTNGHLSSAQLSILYNNKWDIGNHTKDHTGLATLTEAQQEVEISSCKSVLDGLGLTRAGGHVAYPSGQNNADTLIAMAAVGAKTGRLANQMNNGYELYEQSFYEGGFPLRRNSIGPNNTTTLAVVKGWIDKCVLLNISIDLMFHDIVDSNAGSWQWLTSDFSALLDYIESLGLQTLTIDEYYRLNSGPITVHHK